MREQAVERGRHHLLRSFSAERQTAQSRKNEREGKGGKKYHQNGGILVEKITNTGEGRRAHEKEMLFHGKYARPTFGPALPTT